MHDAFRFFTPLPEVFRKLWADLWLPKTVAAGLAGLLDYLLPEHGSRDLALAAAALILLDTATGFWAALVSGKRVSSAKFSRVLTKLLGYGSVVVVCGVASHAVPGAAGFQPVAISGVLGFVVLTEGISILENVGRMGVKAPPFLMDWLRKRLKEKPEE
ncbi:MAG: hypothetical protein BGO01_08845 [Armatimonadetes bacterium 55-13]|nr:phage holin family protein [Armatimonadota bacterium]OJU61968.1 MAG: hypothetical protein BGO01_08845 [Armatimonadetes bacterium 55-13]